jgi:[acyl-carrier-protein] S-malonyltransferase
MMPAQERLAASLATLDLHDPQVPVVANVSAKPVQSAEEIRDALIKQVSSPVRWLESMSFLLAAGVNKVVEVGPGKVLCGLMRQISREVKCVNVEDTESLQSTRASLAV